MDFCLLLSNTPIYKNIIHSNVKNHLHQYIMITMKTSTPCFSGISTIEQWKSDNLSQLINSEYVESRISSFLALLSTVIYKNTYNEIFSVPIYLYINHADLEKSPKDCVQKSFVFDSNANPTFDELSELIKYALASYTPEKTISDNDSVGVIVLVYEQSLSPQMIDVAQSLHQETNSELTCIISNISKLGEIHFLNNNSIRYQRIPEYLSNLATAILNNPNQCIHSFNILSPNEIEQQLIFGQGEKVSIANRPVYKNIEFFATKTPNALAVSSGQKNLTYSQLNCEANQLAHFFLQFPIAIGDKVIAFLPRTTDVINAILAIHKVGAVYVPLDPTFPKERILAILQEVKPQLILTYSEGEEILKNIDIPIFNLEYSGEILTSFPVNNPEIKVNLDHESHIFFTSGTTGKPKGVVATHRNLVQYLSSARNKYKFSSNDRFISTARFTFSISLFKILTPLYVGGSLRIVDRDVVLNLPHLCQELEQITTFHFGPSLLKQLLPYIEENYKDFSPFNKIRHVSSGGDMVPPEILEKLKKIFINAEVYVIYGSSEISCMGCTYQVPRNITLTKTKVGKPHQNMSVRIFDKYGNMVPIGVPGKIYFAGDGLVKGYLNLEKLTAEKFIEIDGERFYSIGDIGRFDTEGNIELLGRDDFQVQIRGMRVELPEIEYHLKRFPGISDCVVVGRVLEENSDISLIAYLVLKINSNITAMKIREHHLYKFLPDYMIPTIFVQLDKLPTNHNAKLDRSQLPAPNIDNILVSATFEKSADDIESVLIAYWEKMFKIEGIGVNHDFFELGGNSLLAVQFLIEVQKRYDKFIPISVILELSTIKDIAAIIRGDIIVPEMGNLTILKQGNSLLPPLFCLYGVLLYKDLADSLDIENIVCSVYLQEEIDVIQKGVNSQEFQDFPNVKRITQLYLNSIKKYQQQGPYFLCGESFGGIIALEVARELIKQGEEVKLVAMLDTHVPGFADRLSTWRKAMIHLMNEGIDSFSAKVWRVLANKDNMRREGKLTTKTNSDDEFADVRRYFRKKAIDTYVIEPYDYPVILFRATQRSDFEPKQIDLGWGEYIKHLTVINIEGDHLGILTKGYVDSLATELSKYITL
jgi:amino acid adenylation domain-containing protein